jgi:hypothetical protein
MPRCNKQMCSPSNYSGSASNSSGDKDARNAYLTPMGDWYVCRIYELFVNKRLCLDAFGTIRGHLLVSTKPFVQLSAWVSAHLGVGC